MKSLLDFLLVHTWWQYDPSGDWYSQPYHWINIFEGVAWLCFAALVFRRYLRHRHSRLELLYCLAFVSFGISDFREAYVVQSWLVLFKGMNLAALLYLRWLIIHRFYPGSKTY